MTTDISLKALGAGTALFISSMLGAATLHSALVVPAIMNEVIAVVEEEVREHETRPHREAISREEFTLILHRMDDLATKSDVRNLAERIQDLSLRLQRLENQ